MKPRASIGKRACTVTALCALAALGSPAQTLTTLFAFNGTDGGGPKSALVQAANGDFYGTSWLDGAHSAGTIFKITPSGTFTTLYNFCSQANCADGEYPLAGLVQATNHDFYGTTTSGGAYGAGTVFKLTPSGTLTTLHSFCTPPNCADGDQATAGLIQATDGHLYGTTSNAGTLGNGTVFKITPSGTLTTVYNFCSLANCADGSAPQAGLIQATDGNFYGTTQYGGTGTQGLGNGGTVFKLTPSGTLTTLYSFCSLPNCADGMMPLAGLVQAKNGDFYGTTNSGGANRVGTIFRITPSGTMTTLHNFCSLPSCADGENPVAGLIQATDGHLYGTTVYGGLTDNGQNQGSGTIFKITPSGTLTTIHSFCSLANCADGVLPFGGIIQATNGLFYGTTWAGDPYGTVYSLR